MAVDPPIEGYYIIFMVFFKTLGSSTGSRVLTHLNPPFEDFWTDWSWVFTRMPCYRAFGDPQPAGLPVAIEVMYCFITRRLAGAGSSFGLSGRGFVEQRMRDLSIFEVVVTPRGSKTAWIPLATCLWCLWCLCNFAKWKEEVVSNWQAFTNNCSMVFNRHKQEKWFDLFCSLTLISASQPASQPIRQPLKTAPSPNVLLPVLWLWHFEANMKEEPLEVPIFQSKQNH